MKKDSSQHVHGHRHEHGHEHGHAAKTLTIRSHSGLSGDMMLAGLICMNGLDQEVLDQKLASIIPELASSVRLIRSEIGGIGGWSAQVSLPHQHEHRTLADILALIESSGMTAGAKKHAAATFTLLAQAESRVHGARPEDICFHEVGALDSILDICLNCELFLALSPERFVVSPLPMADGSIRCAHGVLPAPAPAVLELLDGVPVRPFAGSGETVTPTAIALLKALGAEFGPWPAMNIEKHALVYGTRIFENAANGAVFAFGS